MVAEFRIISTYVENTEHLEFDKSMQKDHLHLRGEYFVELVVLRFVFRIISTYVENTLVNMSINV